jgi:membrane protein implicated in regulation of membrane protease activity
VRWVPLSARVWKAPTRDGGEAPGYTWPGVFNLDAITIAFLVGGLLLIGSELVHLSLVPVFFGVSALITAGLHALGILPSLPASLLAWSITSVALTLPLRPLVRRLLPGAKAVFDPSDEDKDAMGELVEVIDAVDDESASGRIRHQGTTWSARAVEGHIPKGARAKLVYREKMTWVVEAVPATEGVDALPVLPPADASARVPAELPAAVEMTETKKV